jgi:hypothetical protein
VALRRRAVNLFLTNMDEFVNKKLIRTPRQPPGPSAAGGAGAESARRVP